MLDVASLSRFADNRVITRRIDRPVWCGMGDVDRLQIDTGRQPVPVIVTTSDAPANHTPTRKLLPVDRTSQLYILTCTGLREQLMPDLSDYNITSIL